MFEGCGQPVQQLGLVCLTLSIRLLLTHVALTVRVISTTRHQQLPSPGTAAPSGHSPAACAQLAKELSSWPAMFRKASAHLVLGWLMPHVDGGLGAAKLGDALLKR